MPAVPREMPQPPAPRPEMLELMQKLKGAQEEIEAQLGSKGRSLEEELEAIKMIRQNLILLAGWSLSNGLHPLCSQLLGDAKAAAEIAEKLTP